MRHIFSQYLRLKITKTLRLRLALDAEAFRIREIPVDEGSGGSDLLVLLSEVRGSIVARRQLLGSRQLGERRDKPACWWGPGRLAYSVRKKLTRAKASAL